MPRRLAWYVRYGVTPARLRFREHRPDELAHYAKKAVDVEYRFPFGWKELEGIHNRGDWDLGRHQQATGENLEYFDPATEEKYVPWIVETSAGGDRAAFTFLIDAYREEEVRGEKRVVLGFNPDLAPYKVAVLPLLKKRDEIVEMCHKLRDDLAKDMLAVYDDTAAIGKLYRRQDEIGTPWCVTIDVDSLEDGKATIRDRDSMEQIRVDVSQVKPIVMERLAEGSELDTVVRGGAGQAIEAERSIDRARAAPRVPPIALPLRLPAGRFWLWGRWSCALMSAIIIADAPLEQLRRFPAVLVCRRAGWDARPARSGAPASLADGSRLRLPGVPGLPARTRLDLCPHWGRFRSAPRFGFTPLASPLIGLTGGVHRVSGLRPRQASRPGRDARVGARLWRLRRVGQNAPLAMLLRSDRDRRAAT